MADYTVVFTPSAQRQVSKIDASVLRRIKPKVLSLSSEPQPRGCVKLSGSHDLYRVRVGDYRIVYQVDDAQRLVEVTLVAHGREVYRDL